ncbi:hypothetical protein ETH_00035615, partial [Eimeria tenella]
MQPEGEEALQHPSAAWGLEETEEGGSTSISVDASGYQTGPQGGSSEGPGSGRRRR